MNLSTNAINLIKKLQKNELTESIIYKKIAKFAKGQENKDVLMRLSTEELLHEATWHLYTKETVKPDKWKIFKYVTIAKLFGFTFAIKLMERGELAAQKEYDLLLQEEPLILDAAEIKQQEEEHEQALIAMLDEEQLKYIGSMVLGMNDALVELTGSLAGFALAMQNTKLVALAGLIIGISATFSMAASEFLSARQEGRKDAFKSCLYTGIAYICTVALLILPYLLLPQNSFILALGLMLAIVIAIIAIFSFYISVAKDENFKTKFAEMSIVSLGVAILSFGVSLAAKNILGIDI